MSGDGLYTDLFQRMYKSGSQVPWDTQQAQPGLLVAIERGWISSPVLDVGCGFGDNAIFLARNGYDVVGVDYVPEAVEEARKRAAEAGDLPGTISFAVGDVYSHGLPDGSFQTLLDSAVFHCVGAPLGNTEAQRKYIDSISAAVATGGQLVLICFSDDNPDPWNGPRRITEEHARRMWEENGLWRVEVVEPVILDSLIGAHRAKGWLVRAIRQ